MGGLGGARSPLEAARNRGASRVPRARRAYGGFGGRSEPPIKSIVPAERRVVAVVAAAGVLPPQIERGEPAPAGLRQGQPRVGRMHGVVDVEGLPWPDTALHR